MSDREALLKALADHPADTTLQGAFADHLDECGEPAVANAYRWAMRQGLRPHLSAHAPGRPPRSEPDVWWEWRTEMVDPTEPEADLPPPVFAALRGNRGYNHRRYPTYHTAFVDLAEALVRLRELSGY
jgi:uncharacterized protein (TIGR02996 family)